MLNRKKSKGQSLVEYGLILALISVACVTLLGDVGKSVDAVLSKVNTELEKGK